MDITEEWLQKYREFLLQFIEISEEEFDALKGILHPVHLSKGEFFEGTPRESIRSGFIIKGLLRTYFITEGGDEFITDFCRENQITSNYDLLTSDLSHEYFSEAMEETIILAMEYERFLQLSVQYPIFATLKNTLIEQYFIEKINRENDLMSLNASQKYIRFLNTHKEIVNRVPQYHIASYIGITPVALSRIKKDLEK